MEEIPDRWFSRLTKTVRPHGRFAVISSCATAGLLLVVGGVVFASQGDHSISKLGSPTKSAVSSTVETGPPAPHGVTLATTTTTPLPGSNTSVTRQSTSTDPSSANTPPTPAPTTTPPAGVTTTAAPSPTTQSTAAPATTTTTTGPVADSSLKLSVDWDANNKPSPEDPSVSLRFTAADTNGYISSVLVMWDPNDPNSWVNYNNPQACSTPLSSNFPMLVTHKYESAGTYRPAVTATSTDCSGKTQQQVTKSPPAATVGGASSTTTTTTP